MQRNRPKTSRPGSHSRHMNPSDLHLIQGTSKSNPGRTRERAAREPQHTELQRSAPKHLQGDVARAWGELRQAATPHLLVQSDSIAIEVTAHLLVMFRKG